MDGDFIWYEKGEGSDGYGIAAGDPAPVPEQQVESRVKQQTFDYDLQESLHASDDDARTGGPKEPGNYNKIEFPGKKLLP